MGEICEKNIRAREICFFKNCRFERAVRDFAIRKICASQNSRFKFAVCEFCPRKIYSFQILSGKFSVENSNSRKIPFAFFKSIKNFFIFHYSDNKNFLSHENCCKDVLIKLLQ